MLLLWVLLAIVTPGAIQHILSSPGTNTSEVIAASVRGLPLPPRLLFCPLAKTIKVVYTLNFPKTALRVCRTGAVVGRWGGSVWKNSLGGC